MIVVTGATGFVGRYLVDYLVSQGEEVLAAGRSTARQSFFSDRGIPFRQLDVSDPHAFSALPGSGVEAFVHLAATIPAAVQDPRSDIFLKTNTLGTFYALEHCRKNGIPNFLLTTTLYEAIEHTEMPISESQGRSYSLVGDHASYVISKIAAAEYVEHYAREYGLRGIVLRFTGLLGYGRQEGFWQDGVFYPSAFEVFYRRAKDAQALEVWGPHRARRDSLYVKDAVRAIHMAISDPNARGLYGIGSGVGRTNEDEALAFAKVFGSAERPVAVVYLPEKPEKPRTYYFDISKAKRDFGWEPLYDFERTLVDYDAEVQAGRFKD